MKLVKKNLFSRQKIVMKGGIFLLSLSIGGGTIAYGKFLWKCLHPENAVVMNTDNQVQGIEFPFALENSSNGNRESEAFLSEVIKPDNKEMKTDESLGEMFDSNNVRDENQNELNIESVNEKQIEDLFVYYGQVFQVNSAVAYQKASELTNHFQDTHYLETYTIGDTTVYKEKRDWSGYPKGQEIGILTFMRDLRTEAEKFGLDSETIRLTSTIEESEIMDLVTYFSDLFQCDPYIIYSIMSSECGKNIDSKAALAYHNYAGLMNGSSFYIYPTRDYGVLEAVMNFKLKYGDIWEQEDTLENRIVKIKMEYAPDQAENDPNQLNQYWAENVYSYYNHYKEQNLFDSDSNLFVQRNR